MHLEVSRVVKAPRERVYAAYTDFESMPRWSKRLASVKVTRRDGNTVHLESEGVTSKGARRTTAGTLKLSPPGGVESESETRFTRTKRTVAFDPALAGEATTVTASLDVEVKGLWSLVLRTGVRKEAAEASAAEELASFARFVEGSAG